MVLRSAVSFLALLVVIAPNMAAIAAERKPAPMRHHGHKAGATASTRAYEASMLEMHKRMAAPLSGNADVDFARQMLPHHEGAVEMAKTQLRYGHDESLKKLSRWIIRAQEQEIGFLKNWLFRRDNGAVAKNATDFYGEAMATMHHGMMIDYTDDADVDFVRGMIAHHQGAVAMARILIADGNDPDLNQLANDIFSSQNYEISWMQNWLSTHAKH